MVDYNDKIGTELAYDFFQKAKEELKTKNRFSNPEMDKLIGWLIANKNHAFDLEEKKFIYRARIYNLSDGPERFKKPNRRFQGFNAAGSFVNPNPDLAPDGRCNPQFITYLYTAQSKECSICEVRPNIGSLVSVARIKILKSLRLFNLSADVVVADNSEELIQNVYNSTLFLYLNKIFSQPSSNKWDYILSQYISEKVKNNGFDGIAYKSAVYAGKYNINYAIFNYDKCKVSSSKLYKINKINYDFEPEIR